MGVLAVADHLGVSQLTEGVAEEVLQAAPYTLAHQGGGDDRAPLEDAGLGFATRAGAGSGGGGCSRCLSPALSPACLPAFIGGFSAGEGDHLGGSRGGIQHGLDSGGWKAIALLPGLDRAH